jgi:ABC-2 type transport system ATP-binding protein
VSALEVTDLHHRYGQLEALGGVSFSVAPGDVFAVLGHKGAGKSTLLSILGTLAAPTSGSVEIFGIDVLNRPRDARRTTGVMFPSPSLDPWLTVFENLRHHGYLYGLSGHDLARGIERSLERVGLMARASSRVSTLASDIRRRVDLARAILPEPTLLVIDEPGSGLDAATSRELIQDLKRLRDDAGTTIVFSTSVTNEAVLADRVGILQKGRLTAIGKTSDLADPIGRLES